MQRRLQLTAKQGVLRAHVLYLADKPCAFSISSLLGGVYYNDFMGFDPAYAKYAPGSYLAIKVIEEVCNEGRGAPVTAVDFGPGDAEWKARLGNHQSQLISLYIFGPTIKAAACNLLRTCVGFADRSAKAILKQTGLLTDVKRKWRRLVAQSHGDT
jgi:CelD/BcsL family acetyltransferase involved in cellulose biosynthesis